MLGCMVPHTSVLLLIWPDSQKLFYKKKLIFFIFEKINVLVCINSKKKINCCYLTGKCKSKFFIFRHQNFYLFPLLQNIFFYFEIFDRASFLISLTSWHEVGPVVKLIDHQAQTTQGTFGSTWGVSVKEKKIKKIRNIPLKKYFFLIFFVGWVVLIFIVHYEELQILYFFSL